ncbi:peptidase-like protein [Streptomyces sp. Ag109_O5-1]|nr:peptidase-like protein [Streptomyces sp. Ag109_O5-1]
MPFAAAHREELRADVLIASDGPRLDAATPTLFLGARGGVQILLDADLRPGSHHSGNWGGLLRNPATTLAAAVASLVDGHGRIRVPELLPPELQDAVRQSLAGVTVANSPGGPVPDGGWGDPSLTPAERLYGWNTLEVLSIGAGDIDRPVNAIPGRARAVLQLRYVAGTDVGRVGDVMAAHLARAGFSMVDVTVTGRFAAGRTPLDDPWVGWARAALEQVAERPVAVLPNIGGSLPHAVFTDVLGLPALWLPFAVGLLIGPVGYFVRRYVEESPAMADSAPQRPSVVLAVFRDHWGGLLVAGGMLVVSTALNFILQYLPPFGIRELGLDDSLSYVALFVTGAVLTVGTPVAGLLADRHGRVRIMLPAALLIGAAAVPLFGWLTEAPSFLTLTLCMAVLGLLKAAYFGALPSVMADMFPAEARATGLSFSYNTAVAVFGGFTPTIAATLVTATGSRIAPSYYLLAVALLSVTAPLTGARRYGVR